MELRRVVVTGMGVLTPIGNDVDSMWDAMKQGKSGAADITAFDTSLFKTHFACEVKGFNVDELLDRKEARKMDRFAQFAVWTAKQALIDSGLDLDNENREHIGSIWASGMGGLTSLEVDCMDYFHCSHYSLVYQQQRKSSSVRKAASSRQGRYFRFQKQTASYLYPQRTY